MAFLGRTAEMQRLGQGDQIAKLLQGWHRGFLIDKSYQVQLQFRLDPRFLRTYVATQRGEKPMQRFRNILVVVEEESHHAAAVERAIWLARANEARLTFLDVAGSEEGELSRLFSMLPGARADVMGEEVMGFHRERVQALAAQAEGEGLQATAEVVTGTAFLAIIRYAMRQGHDLILKGQHTGASGLTGAFRGPDLHLMRKAPCPVWILRDDTASGTRCILACIDPDAMEDDDTRVDLNRTVMQLALSLAERDGASVDILGVWRVQEEAALRSGRVTLAPGEVDTIVEGERVASLARLEALAAEFADRPVRTNLLHLKGVPGDVIPDHAASAGIDTIVMGTVGRTGISGFFIGNTAETILNRAACSVLTLKPPQFVSPVLPDGAA